VFDLTFTYSHKNEKSELCGSLYKQIIKNFNLINIFLKLPSKFFHQEHYQVLGFIYCANYILKVVG